MKEHYELFSPPVERILDVANRIGKFLAPQQTELCLSTHINREPTDGEAALPSKPVLPMTKEQTAAHYTALARDAQGL